jgi:hypothetical protein
MLEQFPLQYSGLYYLRGPTYASTPEKWRRLLDQVKPLQEWETLGVPVRLDEFGSIKGFKIENGTWLKLRPQRWEQSMVAGESSRAK